MPISIASGEAPVSVPIEKDQAYWDAVFAYIHFVGEASLETMAFEKSLKRSLGSVGTQELLDTAKRQDMLFGRFWGQVQLDVHHEKTRRAIASDAGRIMGIIAEGFGFPEEALDGNIDVPAMNTLMVQGGVVIDDVKTFVKMGIFTNGESHYVPAAQAIYFAATRGGVLNSVRQEICGKPLPETMHHEQSRQILSMDTAVRVERNPLRQTCGDRAAAFTYADGKSGAVVVADGIGSGIESLSAAAAQIVVNTFSTTFQGAGHVLYDYEARLLAIDAFEKAAQAIVVMQDEERERILHKKIDPDQKSQILTTLKYVGSTVNFQTLCIDSHTGALAVVSLNLGDSIGALIDVDTAERAIGTRARQRTAILESAYTQTTRPDRGVQRDMITRSVRPDFGEAVVTGDAIRLMVLPPDTRHIILLSRSDALDKIPVSQDRWIVERLLHSLRPGKRRSVVPLADRFVDDLLSGVHTQWQKPQPDGGLPYDDVSFAALALQLS